ncbi:Hypothetical predicted protein, partial [Olea europaea subsp. europaea]
MTEVKYRHPKWNNPNLQQVWVIKATGVGKVVSDFGLVLCGMDQFWIQAKPEKSFRVQSSAIREQIFKISRVVRIGSHSEYKAQQVATRLGLSLEPTSALLGLVGDDLDRDFQRQGAKADRYIKFQGKQLRQTILEKVRSTQLLTISYVENKILQILQGKEAEVEGIKKKNMELKLLMKRLSSKANAWQQQANYNEKMISTLKINLQKAYAQNTGGKEGCGDSEVNDTALCS